MKISKKDTQSYLRAKHIADRIGAAVVKRKIKHDEQVDLWIEKNPYSKEMLSRMSDPNYLDQINQEIDQINTNRDQDVNRLLESISAAEMSKLSTPLNSSKKMFIWRLSASVAAAVLVIVAVTLFVRHDRIDLSKCTLVETRPNAPQSKPTLILSDGKNLDLLALSQDSLHNVLKGGDDKASEISGAEVQKVEYNTLIVPKMYTYSITLDDGTVVMLNANSKLVYPVRFTGKTREVYLEGEGFFTVTKSSIPFVVKSSDVMIRVYGTVFNVNAINPSNVETVLVSGSVGVSMMADAENETMITPGQMINVNPIDQSRRVTNVDCEQYLAWTKGSFWFESKSLEYIMQSLSMWYGVEFYFKNQTLRDIILTGSFEKDTDLQDILKNISEIERVEFTEKGGRYIVE